MSKLLSLFFLFISLLLIFKCSADNINIRHCASCICEGLSQCNATYFPCTDNGKACGPLRIVKPYWAAAGSPTVHFQNPQDLDAFANCVTDYDCAAQTMQQYVATHQEDCNLDGVINCDDFLLIHMYGPEKCKGRNVWDMGDISDRFLHCKLLVSGLGQHVHPNLNINFT